jgi:hypothetical protein
LPDSTGGMPARDAVITTSPQRAPLAERLVLAGLGAALLALAASFTLRYAPYAWQALGYPYSLDYGEGIVWQQALLIPGPRMYGPIDAYPFIVFHYPPLYHLAVRGLGQMGVDLVLAGRLISLVATLAIAVLAFLVVARAARPSIGRLAYLAGAIGALAVFTCMPMFRWSVLMRVDMLAIALSFLGLYATLRAQDRPSLVYAAGLAFLLALYTKQTSLPAPFAALCVMAIVHPRTALRAGAAAIALGLAGFTAFTWYTDGGFARHLVLYNVNRFELAGGLDFGWRVVRGHALYGLVVALFVPLAWRALIADLGPGDRLRALRSRLRSDPWALALALVTVYLAATTATLVAVAKVGASYNYFLEWLCACCVLVGMAAAGALRASVAPRRVASSTARLAIAIGLPALLVAQATFNPTRWLLPPDPAERPRLAALLERIRAAPQPVLSEDMTLLLRAGKEVPIEPAIFTELSHKGVWDPRRLIELIAAHRFAFVVCEEPFNDQRWTPEMRRAIESAYPNREDFPPYSLRSR